MPSADGVEIQWVSGNDEEHLNFESFRLGGDKFHVHLDVFDYLI